MLIVLPAIATGQDIDKRFEAGVLLSGTFLERIGSSDHGVGTSALGFGGRLDYAVSRHVDLESELIVWPNNQATSGTWIQGQFGARAGLRFHRIGLFAKVRPGFMHFTEDPFGVTKPGGSGIVGRVPVSSTEPSVDLGGVFEYATARGVILRFDLGDTIIHYDRRLVQLSPTLPSIEAGGFTTNNWQGSFGLSWRF